MTIDKQAIIERGYTFNEEYEAIHAEGKLEKLNLRSEDGETEGIWIYPLEDSNRSGRPFHFVFFNDPIMFWGGPRPTAGLVATAVSKGSMSRAEATTKGCIDAFIKTGQAAIDYFWQEREKYLLEHPEDKEEGE